ncbi:GHKL domain-containing protein [candidate division KSB1 bacterium]|nr:GHKL domain-containing protein [candidate division KSB1 bacterium]
MNKTFRTKIVLVVLVALVAPILSYTAFQFAQRNENEALITSIYDRQLTTLLFSVNMHCWDQFISWRAAIASINIDDAASSSNDNNIYPMHQFIARYPSIAGLYLRHENQSPLIVWHKPLSEPKMRENLRRLALIIDESGANIRKMNQLAREGYIRPTIIPWDESKYITLILFPVTSPEMSDEQPTFAGLFVDNRIFVNDIMARKFDSMNEGNFLFAVRNLRDGQFIYATANETPVEPFQTREKLWMIPDLELMVNLQGTTLSDISTNQTRRNLIFIIFVNIVLIAGIVYLFVNIFKEVSLAQMKTDFVANVSHELRTPLALIRMYAETLELGRLKTDEKKQHYYRTIVNESTRLTQLINNILDFSRIESRKKEFNLTTSDIKCVVVDTLEMYRYHTEMKGFELNLDCDDQIPLLFIDKEAIALALVNLLDNAIKYSPDKKRIDVRLFIEKSNIVLSIKDFGIGIPENEQSKIFDKFYRIENSLVHNTKGSGLGLSLVKHIMAIHHGIVKVDSKPEKGSTFSLIFPINYQKGVS